MDAHYKAIYFLDTQYDVMYFCCFWSSLCWVVSV